MTFLSIYLKGDAFKADHCEKAQNKKTFHIKVAKHNWKKKGKKSSLCQTYFISDGWSKQYL